MMYVLWVWCMVYVLCGMVCGIEGVDECFHTTLYQDCWARQYTLERTHTLEMWSRGGRKAKRKQITTGARERGVAQVFAVGWPYDSEDFSQTAQLLIQE